MDLDDLRSAANVICYTLGLQPCEVRVGHGRVSRYVPAWAGQPPHPHVLISQYEPDQLQALLHELAHHVTAKHDAQAYEDARVAQYKVAPGKPWRKRVPVSLHGPVFVEALKSILTLWYGPDWQQHYTAREYERVATALGRPRKGRQR